MYIDSEDQIRKEIREKLFADYLYRPNSPLLEAYYAVSMSANDFKEIFFTPWANFLKGVLIEAKKIASSAVLTLRLLFTINQKKANKFLKSLEVTQHLTMQNLCFSLPPQAFGP